MSAFISFLISFWAVLPWVAIALMAFLALRKSPHSKMLQLQTVGAAATFVLIVLKWVLLWLLSFLSSTPPSVIYAIRNIFDFLLFVSLAVFAIGYCLERFHRRGPEPIQVSARPID